MPDIANLLQRADQTAAVRNELLRKEHVAYCLAWQGLIGPQKTTLYNAIGPDISTVLLTTDAEHVIGVDPIGLDQKAFEFFLENGPGNFSDKASRFTPYSNIWKLTKEKRIKLFNKTIVSRKENCNWLVGSIKDTFGINRLLVYELDKVGVNYQEIEIQSQSDRTTFVFPWGLTSNTTKERKVTYFKGTLDTLFESKNFARTFNSELDCFYQKCFFSGKETEKYLEKIIPTLNSKAAILIGYSLGCDNGQREYRKSITSFVLNSDLTHNKTKQELEPDFTVYDLVNRFLGIDNSHLEYGSRLFGFRLSPKNY